MVPFPYVVFEFFLSWSWRCPTLFLMLSLMLSFKLSKNFYLKLSLMSLMLLFREGCQKKTDYLVTLIKRVGRYLAEITISWSFEIVTCYWGRWVFEEEVTISKQTFRFVLYPLRRIRGQQFCNMVIGHPSFSFGNLP